MVWIVFSDRGLVVAEADADIHMRNDQGLTAFDLAEVPRAHLLIQSGKSIGKLVLRP